MKSLIISVFVCLSAVSWAQNRHENLSVNNVTVDTLNLKFVPKDEAANLLRLEDDISHRWNKFDILSRLKGKEGDKNDLLEFIAQQACDWTTDEVAFLRKTQNSINNVIREKGLRLRYPEEIRMLKTTMMEEDGAGGYTRDNYIVLIDRIKTAPQYIASLLVAHETFHILTRNNAEFRKRMYNLIGFNILPREVEFPQELKERIITNPDVIRHDSYATFTIDGKQTDCAMVIYTKTPYEGGGVLKYMNMGLVAIDKDNCKAIEKDGKAVIYSIDDAEDFYKKVGKNTNYAFDPEEILAENFSFLLTNKQDLETPELVQKMEEICK